MASGPERYADLIVSFSTHSLSNTVFTGDHYRSITGFILPATPRILLDGSITDFQNGPESFVVLHTFSDRVGAKRTQVQSWKTCDDMKAQWPQIKGNRILFFRGYPSTAWLSQIGSYLDLDYELLYQHLANPAHESIAECYCLPPLSLVNTGTIQLTFTNLGCWDNHRSGIDLSSARKAMEKEMKMFLRDLNTGTGLRTCDSIVRSFHLHDLKHFSIEQRVTISLIQREGLWTCE